jgi:hypothetical protein
LLLVGDVSGDGKITNADIQGLLDLLSPASVAAAAAPATVATTAVSSVSAATFTSALVVAPAATLDAISVSATLNGSASPQSAVGETLLQVVIPPLQLQTIDRSSENAVGSAAHIQTELTAQNISDAGSTGMARGRPALSPSVVDEVLTAAPLRGDRRAGRWTSALSDDPLNPLSSDHWFALGTKEFAAPEAPS